MKTLKPLILAVIITTGMSFSAQSQVGIGTVTPDQSAALDVASSTKGFLAPRVALTATNASSPIDNPADGLIIYNTATAGSFPNNVEPGLYVWNTAGNSWDRLHTARSVANNNKIGINLTASANPQKVFHDILWYQTSSGPIMPAQVPWYCENVAKANQLAAYWVQKLINEFKGLENDYHWDQSHNSIIVNSGLLGKIVLGKTALGTGIVDMDNIAGGTNYGSEYFTLVVGSNNKDELYTLEFNIAIDVSAVNYGFRIIFQTNSSAADGHTGSVPYAYLPATAPQCKTRSSFSPLDAGHPAIMAYPISVELNF